MTGDMVAVPGFAEELEAAVAVRSIMGIANKEKIMLKEVRVQFALITQGLQ